MTTKKNETPQSDESSERTPYLATGAAGDPKDPAAVKPVGYEAIATGDERVEKTVEGTEAKTDAKKDDK